MIAESFEVRTWWENTEKDSDKETHDQSPKEPATSFILSIGILCCKRFLKYVGSESQQQINCHVRRTTKGWKFGYSEQNSRSHVWHFIICIIYLADYLQDCSLFLMAISNLCERTGNYSNVRENRWKYVGRAWPGVIYKKSNNLLNKSIAFRAGRRKKRWPNFKQFFSDFQTFSKI